MNLLLVDDHPLFAAGFRHALEHAGVAEVRLATTLAEALNVAGSWPGLDIALFDYRLGGDDGLLGLQAFGTRHPFVARVLISGDETAGLVERARNAGASGFLGKSLALPAVHLALARIAAGAGVFVSSAPADPANPGPTARQREVLTLVARGLPNKRIAHELGIAERTVKLHVTALLESLGARNRTHLLVRARDAGWV